MNTLARLILELLSIWEQFKADRKRLKRDGLIKKARKDPARAFGEHFGGVRNNKDDSSGTDKASD